MAYGKRRPCDECSANQCDERLTIDRPCVLCDGDGCAACDQTGTIRLVGCPRTVVLSEAWDMLEAVALMESGILPEAGGWSDQTASFRSCYRLLRLMQSKLVRQDEVPPASATSEVDAVRTTKFDYLRPGVRKL